MQEAQPTSGGAAEAPVVSGGYAGRRLDGAPPRRRGEMRQGPLAGRYPAVAAMVMLALIPYLALSAALQPLAPIIGEQLHMSAQTLSLSSGLANAAYALGTVLAVQFAQHLPQRRMLVGYALLLVIGSILAAAAQDPAMYTAGRVIQGLCTSLLLIAAVPPLAIGYPANKLRDTAVIMNMCIFGAVALGPFIGGLQAQADAWRPLFWIVAAISLGALVLAVLTFEDAPPANLDSPRDLPAIALAGVGCVAAFFGASQLTSHRFLDPVVIVPLFGGLAAIVVLVVYQYRAKRPLLTVRAMLTSTIPVAGISVALFAAAASVYGHGPHGRGARRPLQPTAHRHPLPARGRRSRDHRGRARTRHHQARDALPAAGRHVLLSPAGILVFAVNVPSSRRRPCARPSGLTGIGLGATVAPALFVAGFSLPSANLQRVFRDRRALPGGRGVHRRAIFVYLAANLGGSPEVGTRMSRALDRLRARSRRRAGRGGPVRARRRRPQTPDLDLPRRRAPSLVFPAAAGETPSTPCHDTGRNRKRRLTWHRQAATLQPPHRSSSPTTAPSSPDSRSTSGDLLAPGGAGDVSASGDPQTWIPPRRRPAVRRENATACRRPRRRPPHTEHRWRKRAGVQVESVAVEAAPTWQGIVETADESPSRPDRSSAPPPARCHRAPAQAASPPPVVTHSPTSVLVVHQRFPTEASMRSDRPARMNRQAPTPSYAGRSGPWSESLPKLACFLDV